MYCKILYDIKKNCMKMIINYIHRLIVSNEIRNCYVADLNRPVDTGRQGGQCPPNNLPNLFLEML